MPGAAMALAGGVSRTHPTRVTTSIESRGLRVINMFMIDMTNMGEAGWCSATLWA